MTANKLVLFEANEIPLPIFHDYAARYPKSAISELMRSGKRYETVCEDQIELDPWISWPTLHRGVPDTKHRVLRFGQDLTAADEAFPPLWSLLAAEGISFGVFGSLHARPEVDDLSAACRFFVPDVFADEPRTFPTDLEAYQQFNLTMTRRSGRNVDRAVPLASLARFASLYLRQFANPTTIASTVRVLAAEIRHPHLAARRRSIQPRIGFDIFARLLDRHQPSLATFHTNNVAAAMHRYWAAAYPSDPAVNEMSPEWIERYQDEIDHAMGALDHMVRRLLDDAVGRHGYTFLLATSLGQAGVDAVPSAGFRGITDLGRFMSLLGVADGEWSEQHAMVPNIAITVAAEKADKFEAALRSLEIDGALPVASDTELPPLSFTRVGDSFQLYFYFEAKEQPLRASLNGTHIAEEELGVGFTPHQDGIACSGRHVPRGTALVYGPGGSMYEGQGLISTLDMAPSILRFLGVEPTPYMVAPVEALFDMASPASEVTIEASGGGVEQTVTLIAR